MVSHLYSLRLQARNCVGVSALVAYKVALLHRSNAACLFESDSLVVAADIFEAGSAWYCGRGGRGGGRVDDRARGGLRLGEGSCCDEKVEEGGQVEAGRHCWGDITGSSRKGKYGYLGKWTNETINCMKNEEDSLEEGRTQKVNVSRFGVSNVSKSDRLIDYST